MKFSCFKGFSSDKTCRVHFGWRRNWKWGGMGVNCSMGSLLKCIQCLSCGSEMRWGNTKCVRCQAVAKQIDKWNELGNSNEELWWRRCGVLCLCAVVIDNKRLKYLNQLKTNSLDSEQQRHFKITYVKLNDRRNSVLLSGERNCALSILLTFLLWCRFLKHFIFTSLKKCYAKLFS